MAHEYFAYWDASAVALVLNWVAAIVGGNDYLGLVRTVGIIGLLACAAGVFARFRGEEFASYLIAFAMLNGVILAPKITVNVIDVRTGNTVAVSNVPFGVGYFAAHMSKIGKWLTENFENIALPTEETRFSKTGFMFGARLVRENLSVNIPPGALYSDLVDYIRYCVNPDLVDMPSIMDEMRVQTDLWAYIGGGVGTFTPNPGRYINVSTDSTGAVSCSAAYTVLSNKLKTTAIPGISDQLSKKLNAGATNAGTLLSTQTPAFESMLFGASRTAEEAIRQGVAINMLIDGEASISSQLDDASGSKIAMAQSFRQANLSSSLMSEIAESALPKFRNAIELMIIGVFPVVALLILVAGVKGGLVLRSYLMTIVWVQLWAPMYALANYAGLNAMGVDFIGIGAGVALPTLGNMSEISSAAITGQTVAGVLALSTPAIAMALVKAGEAGLSGAVGSAMGSVTGGASQAAGAAASGNVSMGNVQWGNESYMNRSHNTTSAGKHQLGGAVESGDRATVSTASGSVTGHAGGGVTAYQAQGSSGGNLSAVGTVDSSRTHDTASGKFAESGHTKESSLSTAKSAGRTLSTDAGFVRALATSLSSMQGFDVGGGFGSSAGNQSRTGGGFNFGSGTAVGELFNLGSSLRVGGGGSSTGEAGNTSSIPTMQHAPTAGASKGGAQGAPAAASARAANATAPIQGDANNSAFGRASNALKNFFDVGLATGTSNTVGHNDTAVKQQSTSSDQSTASQITTLISAANRLAATTNDAQTKQKAERFASALTDIKTAMQSEAHRVSSGERASDTISDKDSGGVKVGQNLDQKAFEKLNPSGSWSGALDALQQVQTATPVAQAAFRDVAKDQSGTPGAIGSKDDIGPAPRTVDAVAANGNAALKQFTPSANAQVVDQNKSNNAMVNAWGPSLDPLAAPDTSAVSGAVNGVLSGTAQSVSQREASQNMATGVAALTNAVFKSDNGVLQTFSNAFLGGHGYKSPQEVSQAIQQAAAGSPGFAQKLTEAGAQVRTNGKLSDETLKGLADEFSRTSPK